MTFFLSLDRPLDQLFGALNRMAWLHFQMFVMINGISMEIIILFLQIALNSPRQTYLGWQI